MSDELRQLLQAIDDARSEGRGAAVATVVRVIGSAYRREGTKMLVLEGGAQVCTVSGGCLEEEVGEIAQRVIATGEPTLRHFDLAEDVVWGLGLGCGGAVDLYLEPLDTSAAHLGWLSAVREGRAALLATVIGGAGDGSGARMLVDANLATTGSLGDAELDRAALRIAREELARLYPRSRTRALARERGGSAEVFLDVSVPPPELVIFGAGHDAIPMAEHADRLGFRVVVVDARHAFVSHERFPRAQRLVRSHPSGFAGELTLGPRSYVLVMNHHLERDSKSLAFALGTPAPYIGVLGPRSRFQDLLGRLREAGVHPGEASLARVRNPIGVDVGADTPEEIAVSVMAELLAVRGGYRAGFLSERDGRIHQPLETSV